MPKKPQDMLEFFRRASVDDPGEAVAVATEEEHQPPLEPTPRLLLLRRSQIVVAAVAGGLVLVLVFLLGLALGGDEAPQPAAAEGVGGWVIRVISYDDNPRNEEQAQTIMGFLAKQYAGQEVTLQRIPSAGKIVVTLGAWVHHPDRYARARQLLDQVKKIVDKRSGKLHFSEAYFWRIGR